MSASGTSLGPVEDDAHAPDSLCSMSSTHRSVEIGVVHLRDGDENAGSEVAHGYPAKGSIESMGRFPSFSLSSSAPGRGILCLLMLGHLVERSALRSG